MESLKQWQHFWDKKFESVRLRWLNSLSPHAFEFFKNIDFIFAEEEPMGAMTGYHLYFKTKFGKMTDEKIFRISIYKGTQLRTEFFITDKFGRYKYIEYDGAFVKKIKNPFEKDDLNAITLFTKELHEDIRNAVSEILEEHRKRTKEKFREKYVGLTIEGYDEKRQLFLLSDGSFTSASFAYSGFSLAVEEEILQEKDDL